MRLAFVVLLAGVCALATAVPYWGTKGQVADKVFLKKQLDVLRLFKYVNQPAYYRDFVEYSKTFHIGEHADYYTNPKAVKAFTYYWKHGMLPRGRVFSVFYEEHLKEAIALFKLFYYAKDYETFFKTAAWARNNVNEGLYLYALSVAVVHRDDTYGIVLPPIYEIYPYYFINAEAIQKAQTYKQIYTGVQNYEEGSYKGFTINYNYTGWYLNVNSEHSMSYFTEDVGINAYYYYYNLYYPFWMGGDEFQLYKDKRGEQFYYFYQQFLARFYLERLSNGFGAIPTFDWQRPIEYGYYPTIRYPNGLQFTVRPNYAFLFKNYYTYGQSYAFKSKYAYSYTYVQDYERRIRDAIDRGYVYTKDGKKVDLFDSEGFDVLGRLIEANPDSPNYRYYGSLQTFARHLLGYSFQPYDKYMVAPSALEHFETSLRDPAFWQFYKRLVLYFQKYKSYLPKYTWDELNFEGIKVENFEVDRLVTYFDKFDVDVTQAVYVNQKEFESDSFQVRVRQNRLNHKPFTYKIYVQSTKPTKSVVRVFMGPKYDEYGRYINLTNNRMNFVEFDQFVYELKSGKNVIERSSSDADVVPDRTSYKYLYKSVEAALNGQKEFVLDGSESYYGFPARYLLPKGTRGGQVFQFYVIVSPYKPYGQYQKDQFYYYPKVGTGAKYIDSFPQGYPFDRPIDKWSFFVPNSYFKDVVVYHRSVSELNTPFEFSQYPAGTSEHWQYSPQSEYAQHYAQAEQFHHQYPSQSDDYPQQAHWPYAGHTEPEYTQFPASSKTPYTPPYNHY